MAEDKASAKRLIKSRQTVRQRADSAAAPKKVRRLTTTGRSIAKGYRRAGSGTAKVLKPLGFALKPLKTKPARFTGRVASKVLLLSYFMGSWRELKDVKWPGRKDTAKLTTAVFVFALFFGILIAVVDYGLDKLFKKLILK